MPDPIAFQPVRVGNRKPQRSNLPLLVRYAALLLEPQRTAHLACDLSNALSIANPKVEVGYRIPVLSGCVLRLGWARASAKFECPFGSGFSNLPRAWHDVRCRLEFREVGVAFRDCVRSNLNLAMHDAKVPWHQQAARGLTCGHMLRLKPQSNRRVAPGNYHQGTGRSLGITARVPAGYHQEGDNLPGLVSGLPLPAGRAVRYNR